MMKKYGLFLFSLLASGFFLAGTSSAAAFESSGLQPVAPYGVFSTFSADGLKQGKAAASVSLEKGSEPDFYRYSAHIAYGFANNVEFSMSVPYVSEWEKKISGFEDMAVGIKHGFFTEGRYGPSVAYIVTGSFGSGRDEFSTDGALGVGLVVSKRVGPVSGHANLIYSTPDKSSLRDNVAFAAGFDFSVAHNFKILAELYGKKSYYSSEIDQLEARFGYRFLTRENIFTTIGAGFDIKDRSPQYRVMLSVTVACPKEKRVIRKVFEEGE
ncbi:MAG: transporter [Thermodesulfovibrionales bacterium]|nr:transporter [Thermodesulfovibrionales bacterium]